MIPDQIRSYLEDGGVPFRAATHPVRMTAQRTAEAARISGKKFGKTIVLREGDRYVMAVVPANERVDLTAMRDLFGSGLDLVGEQELAQLFPDCEVGAMPPFGGLYGLPVIADACLARQDTVAINGGTHTDVIELRWDDFVQTEHPRIVSH